MDPKGPPPDQPTPTASAFTPIATNPLNGRPIFLNNVGALPPSSAPTSTSTTSDVVLPTIGPATSTAAAKPPPSAKLMSYSLHFSLCVDNCGSAIPLTGVVIALFVGSLIFMFMHRKRRSREYEETPIVSVATKFTGGAGGGSRDLKSSFDARGFNSFDEYNSNKNNESYYDNDYVEGYAGVAGFGSAGKDHRQSTHAGIGGFGVPKTNEPVPPLPPLNALPPSPQMMPAPEAYDPAYADYQDEWDKYQREETMATLDQPHPLPQQQQQQQQQRAYRGGHDSTVEGMYFAPQAYGQDDHHGHDHDMDEDHAFEPSLYFQAKPMGEDEQTHYAVPLPQFEVEDYYMRDHLTADALAANAPNWEHKK